MLDATIRNEYVLAAWTVSTLQANGTRAGCIDGPNGATVYLFAVDGGVWALSGTVLV